MRLGRNLCAFAATIAVSLIAADRTLTRADQEKLIAGVTKELREKYVFPEMGSRMASVVEEKLRSGGYEASGDPATFAKAVTADLQGTSQDRHLRILYNNPAPQAAPSGRPPTPVGDPQRLPGNLGYNPIRGFAPPEAFGPPFERAMKELANTDAMIIDLRNNGGGSPDSVMLTAGYFIAKRTLVAKIYSRPDDSTTEMWTTEVAGPHYEKPMYILTNKFTFSAAEAMAYHMQALGRAITVGEASGGGAHRVSFVPLGDGFVFSIAFTRPTNVVTGKDWEGTGVIPNIPAPAESALEAAQQDAVKKLKR
jgi:hypothetical protein